MEAQACGLPAVVGAEGGPKESVADGASGIIIPSNDPPHWAGVIDQLLSDEPRRLRMSLCAIARAARYDLSSSFEQFWAEHLAAAEPEIPDFDLINTSKPELRLSVPPPVSKDPASL